jgi:hypothetical protein
MIYVGVEADWLRTLQLDDRNRNGVWRQLSRARWVSVA